MPKITIASWISVVATGRRTNRVEKFIARLLTMSRFARLARRHGGRTEARRASRSSLLRRRSCPLPHLHSELRVSVDTYRLRVSVFAARRAHLLITALSRRGLYRNLRSRQQPQLAVGDDRLSGREARRH